MPVVVARPAIVVVHRVSCVFIQVWFCLRDDDYVITLTRFPEFPLVVAEQAITNVVAR